MGNAICTVCHENLAVSLVNCVATQCGHIFHPACLAAWNERSNLCPYCANNAGQTIQLFLLDDGTDHNRQLRQLHELLKTAIQLLEMRSSGSQDVVPGSFENLFDFLDPLENNEIIKQLINLEILRDIAFHIVSTNANISELLTELKNRKKRDSTMQNELKHVRKLKQPKNRIH